ncbi:MAG: insulinase family protein [Deltaproteobacteria bacterium]|nr:insulinase family protein [Deltaproteobacteria bacterium]
MKQLAVFFVVFGVLFLQPLKAAKVAFEGKINGFPVLFIDTEFGNEVHFGAVVPTGMGLDKPVELEGISHLIEHQVFRRTDKFENGEREVNRIARQIGGGYNAHTGNELTAFYMKGHPDGLPLMIGHIGAMISSFRPEETSFLAERAVVIEESRQYLNRDSTVVWDALAEQLPIGHWNRKYSIGLPQNLERMSIDLALDYYYANYQPRFVTIVVTGNFSGVLAQRMREIKSWIGRSFHAPQDRRPPHKSFITPGPEIELPPLNSPANAHKRILEIKANTDQRLLIATFQLPENLAGMDFDALELVHDALRLHIPGGFVDHMKARGWLRGMETNRLHLNNLNTADLVFELTEDGYSHRFDVLTEFLALIGEMRKTGIPPLLLSLALDKEVASYGAASTNPESLFGLLEQNLWRGGDWSTLLNADRRFGAVRPETIARTLEMGFPVDQMMVRYLGPEVLSEERSELFDRPMRFEDPAPHFARWQKAVSGLSPAMALDPHTAGIQIPKTLGRPVGKEEGRNTIVERPGTTLLTLESNRTQNAGIIVRLQFSALTPLERSALTLYFSAYQRSVAPLVEIYNIQELVQRFTWDEKGELSLWVEGPREAARSTAVKLIEGFGDGPFTDQDIAKAFESEQVGLESSHQGFTSGFAMRSSLEAFARDRTTRESVVAGMAPFQTRDQLLPTVQGVFQRGCDIRVSSVGSFGQEDANAVVEAIRGGLFHKMLNEADRQTRKQTLLIPDRSVSLWRPLPAGQSPDAVAAARLYGPFQGLTESRAAFRILGGLMNEEIFILNRSQKGLGYTHGARIANADHDQLFLVFYGQATGTHHTVGDRTKSTLDDMLAGWAEALEKVRTRALSPSSFSEAALGLTRRIEIEPTSFGAEAVERDISHEAFARTEGRLELAALVKRMSVGEIYSAADSILFTRPTIQVVTSAEKPTAPLSCADGLLDFGGR